MKKVWMVLAIVAFSLVIAQGLCQAESLSISESLSKIPALKQGVAFNVLDSEFEYLSTIEIANYKGITLEAGFATNDKAVGVISYKLASAKDYGITVPIVDLLELNVGVYAGYGRVAFGKENSKDNNEFSFGPSITLINCKW